MASESVAFEQYQNGMTVLVERLPAVRSAAVSLTVPAGAVFEPLGKNGTAALLSEWLLRGAGNRDSRELSIAFDQLGVQHSLSPGWHHLTLSAATVAHRLPEALRLIADIIRRPRLDNAQFQMCCVGREQVLRSMEDEPRQKLMVELRRRAYAPPFNRPLEGTLDHLPQITADDVRQHYQDHVVPAGTILGIAGFVDPQEIHARCRELFTDWSGDHPPAPQAWEPADHSGHIPYESTQTQIGIAYPSVPPSHSEYYQAWACVSILSGGMSSRLFTKVREERGLCYAIGATLNALKERARVFCYAGTTNDRAQETLDVTLQELKGFGTEITAEELQRCQARAKSSLIMQEESTMARAGSLVRDWFHLGRVTTLEEIRGKVEALTVESIRDFATAHSAEKFQVLTLGPKPLECAGQVDVSDL